MAHQLNFIINGGGYIKVEGVEYRQNTTLEFHEGRDISLEAIPYQCSEFLNWGGGSPSNINMSDFADEGGSANLYWRGYIIQFNQDTQISDIYAGATSEDFLWGIYEATINESDPHGSLEVKDFVYNDKGQRLWGHAPNYRHGSCQQYANNNTDKRQIDINAQLESGKYYIFAQGRTSSGSGNHYQLEPDSFRMQDFVNENPSVSYFGPDQTVGSTHQYSFRWNSDGDQYTVFNTELAPGTSTFPDLALEASSLGNVDPDNPEISYTIEDSNDIEVNFEDHEDTYYVSVENLDPEFTGGTISVNGQTVNSSESKIFEFNCGELLKLKADSGQLPNEFKGWHGYTTNENEELEVRVQNSMEFKGLFGIREHNVYVSSDASGNISKPPGFYTITYGDTFSISAHPEEGFSFINWTGDIYSEKEDLNFVVEDDISIHANFDEVFYDLEILNIGHGGTFPEEGIYTHKDNDQVEIVAQGFEGKQFIKFIVNGKDYESNILNLVMDEYKSVIALFEGQDVTKNIELQSKSVFVTKLDRFLSDKKIINDNNLNSIFISEEDEFNSGKKIHDISDFTDFVEFGAKRSVFTTDIHHDLDTRVPWIYLWTDIKITTNAYYEPHEGFEYIGKLDWDVGSTKIDNWDFWTSVDYILNLDLNRDIPTVKSSLNNESFKSDSYTSAQQTVQSIIPFKTFVHYTNPPLCDCISPDFDEITVGKSRIRISTNGPDDPEPKDTNQQYISFKTRADYIHKKEHIYINNLTELFPKQEVEIANRTVKTNLINFSTRFHYQRAIDDLGKGINTKVNQIKDNCTYERPGIKNSSYINTKTRAWVGKDPYTETNDLYAQTRVPRFKTTFWRHWLSSQYEGSKSTIKIQSDVYVDIKGQELDSSIKSSIELKTITSVEGLENIDCGHLYLKDSLPHHIWNAYDEFALLMGLDRVLEIYEGYLVYEQNDNLKERTLDVRKNPPGAHSDGLEHSIPRQLNLDKDEVKINTLNDIEFLSTLYDDRGLPTPKLRRIAARIKENLHLYWDEAKWDEGYWDSVDPRIHKFLSKMIK